MRTIGKLACISAAMGGLVFLINADEGLAHAGIAAAKQAGYTFAVATAIERSCSYLATRIRRETLAVTLAATLPWAASVGMTYGVHSMKGTPKPVESTIPTACALPLYVLYAKRQRTGSS